MAVCARAEATRKTEKRRFESCIVRDMGNVQRFDVVVFITPMMQVNLELAD